MRVKIEIKAGANREPVAADLDKNLDVLAKLSGDKKLSSAERQSVLDTMSILRGLQKNMPH